MANGKNGESGSVSTGALIFVSLLVIGLGTAAFVVMRSVPKFKVGDVVLYLGTEYLIYQIARGPDGKLYYQMIDQLENAISVLVSAVDQVAVRIDTIPVASQTLLV